VGNEVNEECLLSYARYGTASQLDKTVRLYRQQYNEAGVMMVGYHNAIETGDGSEIVTDEQRRDAENQGTMHHHEHRFVDTRWDEHGCLEIRARLTPEQGALVIKIKSSCMSITMFLVKLYSRSYQESLIVTYTNKWPYRLKQLVD